MKVVVGASSFSRENAEALQDKGIILVENPYGRKMTQDEIIKHLQGAEGLLAGLELLDNYVFQHCPKLRAIARIGVGMDNVDLKAADEYGIKVSNTPDAPVMAVTEMTLAALLGICRNIITSNRELHQGVWKKRRGYSISELSIFIIGYGNIGVKMSEVLNNMGANVMIYDKYRPEVCTCSLEEGLRCADVVSIHASGKEEIMSEKTFHLMKNGVILLNSARGDLINEKALYNALKAKKVSAFWGDAFWEEPYNGMIKECENAILTPHISTYTKQCRSSMERQAVANLLKDL